LAYDEKERKKELSILLCFCVSIACLNRPFFIL